VAHKGPRPLQKQRTLIREALTHIGWEPALAERDAEGFSGGSWKQYVRGFVPEWDGSRKSHKLRRATVDKLTPDQFDLLLGDGPASSARIGHLAVRMFVAVQNDTAGCKRPALLWSAATSDETASTQLYPGAPRTWLCWRRFFWHANIPSGYIKAVCCAKRRRLRRAAKH
jgi:hypothetical protein